MFVLWEISSAKRFLFLLCQSARMQQIRYTFYIFLQLFCWNLDTTSHKALSQLNKLEYWRIFLFIWLYKRIFQQYFYYGKVELINIVLTMGMVHLFPCSIKNIELTQNTTRYRWHRNNVETYETTSKWVKMPKNNPIKCYVSMLGWELPSSSSETNFIKPTNKL